MIAWPGLLAYKAGLVTPLNESTVTQRYRTDDVDVVWRQGKMGSSNAAAEGAGGGDGSGNGGSGGEQRRRGGGGE
jgi:hypothetical protein